jgi:pyruvate kinase
LEVGDFITIDFHSVTAEVIEIGDEQAVLRIRKGGRVGNNKACNVHRPIELPAITAKDRLAIDIGREMGVDHFALSFANRPGDVREMRQLIGPKTTLISKIESRSGILHLEEIARLSDAILIDRGDLSREVELEQIPGQQKDIITRVKAIGRPVYVATNLLESMVHSPVPTLAEINDIYNTLADGVHGVTLAAETAVGEYPIGCVEMVRKVIIEFERPR